MMRTETLRPKIHCEKLEVYNTCSSFLTKVDQILKVTLCILDILLYVVLVFSATILFIIQVIEMPLL